jgi:hypothetical protein
MVFPRCFIRKLLLTLALGLCVLPASAQAHPEVPRERPGVDPARPEISSGRPPSAPRNLSPEAAKAAADAFNHRPKVVLWKKNGDLEHSRDYRAYEFNQTGTEQRPLSLQGLEDLYKTGSPIVNTGDVPHGENWHKFIFGHSDQTVIHEKDSANRDLRAIAEATALAGRPLDPGTTKVFNALPQETHPASSLRERTRMGIAGSQTAWGAMNAQIKSASQGFSSHVADKTALFNELQYGRANVIVIYAHFDGTRLYLPGAAGGTLSIDEIARIDRTKDPAVRERVIVLAACSTAYHFSNSASLASVLLQKGIARTVLATDRPYDARGIPDLMTHLGARTPLREAGGQLLQYVELRNPEELPGQPFGRRPESEEAAGE